MIDSTPWIATFSLVSREHGTVTSLPNGLNGLGTSLADVPNAALLLRIRYLPANRLGAETWTSRHKCGDTDTLTPFCYKLRLGSARSQLIIIGNGRQDGPGFLRPIAEAYQPSHDGKDKLVT